MLMNIIMFVAMYPVIVIMGFVFKHLGKSNKEMIFGVHLTDEMKKDERVIKADKSFDRSMIITLIAIDIIPFLFLLSKHVSVQFTLWLVWFLAALAVMSIPYIKSNKAVLMVKKEYVAKNRVESAAVAADEGVEKTEATNAGTQDKVFIETNIVRDVKLIDVLPPVVVSVICFAVMVFAGSLFHFDQITMDMLSVYQWIVAVFALCTVLFCLCAKWTDRLRGTVISQDSRVNAGYNRARKHIWKQVWCRIAWLNTIVVLGITAAALLQFHSFLIFMVLVVAETVVVLFLILKAAGNLEKVDRMYSGKKDKSFDPDDDDYWKWGMFYNNPNDKRTMVDKRFGVGTTSNIATKTGKATIWIAVIALIWIPFLCVYLIMEDFTPMHLMYEDDVIICQHLKNDYEIPVEKVLEFEVVDSLPAYRSKISGIGTDQVEKGKYACKDYGTYYTFVYCENNCFIRITTDEKTYVVSGVDDAETMSIAGQIENAVKGR